MSASALRLFHVRHGETDWNAEGRLQGRTDTPMNARGLAQAERNGRALAERLAAEGIAPEALAWRASPLGRARRTMEIVRRAAGLDPLDYRVDERLVEIDFGAWSGRTTRELVAAGEGERVARRKRDKWGFRPPGGESYAELSGRIAAVLAEIDRDTVVVSHGGVYRTIHGHLLGTPTAEIPVLDARQDAVALFRDGGLEWI